MDKNQLIDALAEAVRLNSPLEGDSDDRLLFADVDGVEVSNNSVYVFMGDSRIFRVTVTERI